MPTLPPVDKATLKALRAGSEQALEKILRAAYPGLLTEAAKQSGDTTMAPRFVQNAMIQLWDERGRFETAEEIDQGLHNLVRGAVVREQRRRSLQGAAAPATPGPEPKGLNEVWKNVAAAIRASKPAAQVPKHHPAEAGRHHAAPHIPVPATRRSWVGPIVGGVVFVLLLPAFFWWANRKGEQSNRSQLLKSPEARIYSFARGQHGDIEIADGTKVSVGAQSKVIVPPVFMQPSRFVGLDGTASFTATASETDPFEVRAGNAVIVTKGTVFGVRAYPDEGAVTVRVKEGQVSVQVGTQPPRAVAAGQALSVAKDGAMSEPSADALEEAFSWVDGKFTIVNRPLKDVLPEMNRWYVLELQVKDDALLSRPVSLSASIQSKKDAIAALEKSAEVKFAYEGQKPTLQDAPKAVKPTKAAKQAKKKK